MAAKAAGTGRIKPRVRIIDLRAGPAEKLKLIAGAATLTLKPGRFRPPDELLAMFVERTGN